MSTTGPTERKVEAGSSSAVVTGCASGMGAAVAHRLVAEGWTVLGLDLDADALDKAVAELGPRFIARSVDVTDRVSVDRAVDGVQGLPELRAVVNAAGIYPPTTLDEHTRDLYRSIFDVNVWGTVNVTAACVERARSHGRGANIVNFSSADAFAVSPGQLFYSASKAAVVSITKTLALELAPEGFRVNAVSPGWVNTPGTQSNERMREAISGLPFGRAAAPEEIADWVLTLAEANNGYVTGETVMISGGSALR